MLKRDAVLAQSHLDLEACIRKRAHEIWLRRTGRPEESATALDDWLQAEREVLGESRQPAQDRGTTVGDAHRPERIDLGEA